MTPERQEKEVLACGEWIKGLTSHLPLSIYGAWLASAERYVEVEAENVRLREALTDILNSHDDVARSIARAALAPKGATE